MPGPLQPHQSQISTLQSQLSPSYYNTVAHNTLLYKELARILNALAEADIPVIVLKGAALAQTLYPDPATSINSVQRLRPMGNLDLLMLRERRLINDTTGIQ